MTQYPKYFWLINTIRRAGKISHKDLSVLWERNKSLSDYKPLHRTTFNRWREAIATDLGIFISCQRKGGYLYYIENPEDIDDNKIQRWMLNSFAVSDTISEYLPLKDRIIVEDIPSGQYHLTTILEAMKESKVVNLTYKSFKKDHANTFPVEPYCIRLFENRWYVLAHNVRYGDIRIFGLDRVENAEIIDKTFSLPEDFDASSFFAMTYGIVIGEKEKPQRIVLRANRNHKNYH